MRVDDDGNVQLRNKKTRESKRANQVSKLERLREAGDYLALANELPADWQSWNIGDQRTITLRLLVADLRDRQGDVEGMSHAIEPYINRRDLFAFGLADRFLVAQAAYEFKRGDSAQALRLAETAQAASTSQENTFYLGEALQLQAEALWNLGKSAQAIDRFREAVTSFDQNQRYYRLALTSARLGEVLYFTGSLEEARELMRRAIALLVDSPDQLTLALVRESLAELLSATGEHDYAVEHLTKAADIYQELGDKSRLIEVLAEISLALYLANNHIEAEAYFARALNTATQMGVPLTSRFHEATARVYLEQRDFTETELAVRQAIETAVASGVALDKARARRTAAKLYLVQERYTEAVLPLRSALDHSVRAKHKVLELKIKALLALACTGADLQQASLLITEVEAELGDLPLPQIKYLCAEARKRILTPREDCFVVSDRQLPSLAEARSNVMSWSSAQAIRKTDGDANLAAKLMGVSSAYIRKLGQLIRNGGSPDKTEKKKSRARKKQQEPT